MIVRVNDAQQSIDFSTRILGLHCEGERGPGKALYSFDLNKHRIEIRYYEG